MNRRFIAALVAFSLATVAHSAQLPEASKKDKRIRFATYDAEDVITIYTRIGNSTKIIFEDDEHVVDMVGGDVDAWGADTTLLRNGVFLKPAAVSPDADLHVITNKRKYTFDLKLAGKSKGPGPFLTVYFRYPAVAHTADPVVKNADHVKSLLGAAMPVANRRYTVQGSIDLAPIEAWDDGQTTFLRFRARGSIPAIYSSNKDDGSLEKIENAITKDGVVQVPRVLRKLVLRAGQDVACVFNDGYDPYAPRAATSTISPYVQRTVKEPAK